MRYGLQLYSVRDSLMADYRATLRAVAALGYGAVETIGVESVTAAQVRAWCDELGLSVCGTHTGPDALAPDAIEKTIADHRALKCPLLIIPGLDLSTSRHIDAFAALVRQARPLLAQAGITLAFHNHSGEFYPNRDGLVPFEELVAHTPLCFELDTYWAFHAGQDPVRLMERLGSRLAAIHLKDGARDGTGFPLGMGEAPVRACWEKAREMGVPVVVESETQRPDGLTEAQICMEYLKGLE